MFMWRRGVVVATLVSINQVNLRWAWLVLGWVTVSEFVWSMSEHIRGSDDDALYKPTYTLLYLFYE